VEPGIRLLWENGAEFSLFNSEFVQIFHPLFLTEKFFLK
jgi:hypothetical protein